MICTPGVFVNLSLMKHCLAKVMHIYVPSTLLFRKTESIAALNLIYRYLSHPLFVLLLKLIR